MDASLTCSNSQNAHHSDAVQFRYTIGFHSLTSKTCSTFPLPRTAKPPLRPLDESGTHSGTKHWPFANAQLGKSICLQFFQLLCIYVRCIPLVVFEHFRENQPYGRPEAPASNQIYPSGTPVESFSALHGGFLNFAASPSDDAKPENFYHYSNWDMVRQLWGRWG